MPGTQMAEQRLLAAAKKGDMSVVTKQLKAAQAKVNSRVVVVYEEEDEAAGGGAMVQVPYAGGVTKVAAAKGMLVLFEGGESVWVDERAGDDRGAMGRYEDVTLVSHQA